MCSVPVSRAPVYPSCWQVTPTCGQVGYGGGVYRVGGGGVVPSQYTRYWYCQGPTNASNAGLRPLRPLQGPAGPSAHPELPALSIQPQDQYRRDSIINILKLVRIRECRLKSVMRPAIVPDSKTGSKVMTLNFQDFQYRQPSLARNKWSCF